MGFNIQTNTGTPLNVHGVPNTGGGNLSVEQYYGDTFFIGAASALAVSASSVQSGAIGISGTPSVVRICSTANCHYAVGTAPTASSASPYLPAGVIERIRVQGAQKLAVIQDGASTGSLTIALVNTTDQ